MYQLAEGTLVGVPQNSWTACTTGTGETLSDKLKKDSNFKSCIGFIDVNGVSKPNKETTKCYKRKTNDLYNLDVPCTVKSKDVKDIYPVVFHDTTVEPATAAGKYVLNTSK